VPRNLQEAATIWRALDEDCSGWVALREFDEFSFEKIAGFKSWAETTHGSVVKAVRYFDSLMNSTGRLTLEEMQKKVTDDFPGGVQMMFEMFDVHNLGRLTEGDLKFLDNWDLPFEEWETEVRHNWKESSKVLRPSGAVGSTSLMVAEEEAAFTSEGE